MGRDTRFKTYSDGKLARLLLDNDFSFHLFKQVFDLIQDPDFSFEDITFKDTWEIYELISGFRREDAGIRNSRVPCQEVAAEDDEPTSDSESIERATYTIPPLVLDLVVDRMVEDEIPFGVAAMEQSSKKALERNGPYFRSMSLVHRSWTSSAQSGLQCRAVVPYQHIDRFLLSPLCGPWIRELIIYWTVDDSKLRITENDLSLLDALLRRTPIVRSLSFNTFLVWEKSDGRPSLHVDRCLEMFSARLPGLENLWLKHFTSHYAFSGQDYFSTCNELPSLYEHLPKFHSLQFLSIRSWSRDRNEDNKASLGHPPSRLKTVELDLHIDHHGDGLLKRDLVWLLKPRDNFRLQSLAIVDRVLNEHTNTFVALDKALAECLPTIEELRVVFTKISNWRSRHSFNAGWLRWARRFPDCRNMSNFESFMLDHVDFACMRPSTLPSSLKRWAIHCCDEELRYLLETHETASEFFSKLESALPQLPHLRNILVTGSRSLGEYTNKVMHLDAFVHHMDNNAPPIDSEVTRELIDSFRAKHDIELTFLTNAFPRDWSPPRRTDVAGAYDSDDESDPP